MRKQRVQVTIEVRLRFRRSQPRGERDCFGWRLAVSRGGSDENRHLWLLGGLHENFVLDDVDHLDHESRPQRLGRRLGKASGTPRRSRVYNANDASLLAKQLREVNVRKKQPNGGLERWKHPRFVPGGVCMCKHRCD